MNVPKHVAGIALFTLIVGVSVFIAGLLTEPAMTMRIPPVPIDAPLDSSSGAFQSIDYKVQFVSLDFINRKSYTTLSIKRRAEDFRPARLWVYTSFFTAESPRKIWLSAPVEIKDPFVSGDEVSLTVPFLLPEASRYLYSLRATYYARVGVSAVSSEAAIYSAEQMGSDIETAIPVLVQVDRNERP